jgi:hypothetical protein
VADWARRLRDDPVSALLGAGNTSLDYFVRRDLQNSDVGPIDEVWSSSASLRLLRGQRECGSWRGATPKREVYPPNHSDLIETFKRIRLLVERHELTREHPAMVSAAEYLFSFQSEAGDLRGFIGNQYATYYTGYVLSLLIRAGYADDPRVGLGMRWLLSIRQNDGGWTIPILTHRLDRAESNRLTSTDAAPLEPDRAKPFSHNWTDMVLRAFAVHPDYRNSPEARHAAFLLKGRFFLPDSYGSYQHQRYWTRFGFWWPNLLTAMESLTNLGTAASDVDMQRGCEWFVTHQAADGLWHINNDGKPDRDTPLVRERRAWLGLRICRLLKRLSCGTLAKSEQ